MFESNSLKNYLSFLFCIVCLLLPCTFSLAQSRLAILDFNGETAASSHMRELAGVANFMLLEKEQLQISIKGAGYKGALNLSVEEARALGLSLGCDYYVIGTAQILRRLASEKEFYFDVYVAGFLVETQSGQLLRFAFEKLQVAKEMQARKQLLDLTEKIWRQFADVLKSPPKQTLLNQTDDVYDLASAEATRLKIKSPQFFRRIKPTYTESASFADVTASVEMNVIFRADGQIGSVEIIRWAGFGLDESALATIRQLRFEPAKLNERPVSVSAVVRYNFGKEEKAK